LELDNRQQSKLSPRGQTPRILAKLAALKGAIVINTGGGQVPEFDTPKMLAK